MSPIITFFIYFPLQALVTITLMTFISVLVYSILNKKYKNKAITKRREISCWLLITYSEILLYLTVLGRRSLDYYRYNFKLGYSYQEVFVLKDYTLASQIFINIFMFIPVGIMTSLVFEKKVRLMSIIYGLLLSLIIEVLQLILRRGYCEFDDLISNVLGTIIGYLGMCVFKFIKKNLKKFQ